MKKLLAVILVLGMASIANADLVLSVNGEVAPDEITLVTSEIITLDVAIPSGSSLLGGQVAIELSNAQGELLGGEFYPDAGFMFPWYTMNSSSSSIEMTGGNFGAEIAGPITIMDGLLFHCLEETDVIITLHVTGPTTQEGLDVPVSTILDQIIVHQVIPEPMTVALLGLGSLFLLRRRK